MREAIPHADTWPETARLLWRLRHRIFFLAGYRLRFCPSCGHGYPLAYYRDHLTTQAHADQRGWWRAAAEGER